ncbi:MAG: hypothetical protein U0271_34040 [Polyangiaceae bacterium]
MVRLASVLIGASVLGALATGTGCYPEFSYGGSGGQSSSRSSSGVGAEGGTIVSDGGFMGSGGDPTTTSSTSTSTSTTTTSTSTSSSSSGMMIPTVPCYQDNGMLYGECGQFQDCCYDYSDGTLDHCSDAGTCPVDQVWLGCNEPSDCPNEICCAYYSNITGFLGIWSCTSDCSGSNMQACNTTADCDPGKSCVAFFPNVLFYADSEYDADYRVCL